MGQAISECRLRLTSSRISLDIFFSGGNCGVERLMEFPSVRRTESMVNLGGNGDISKTGVLTNLRTCTFGQSLISGGKHVARMLYRC